jgi:hypothetical protein
VEQKIYKNFQKKMRDFAPLFLKVEKNLDFAPLFLKVEKNLKNKSY